MKKHPLSLITIMDNLRAYRKTLYFKAIEKTVFMPHDASALNWINIMLTTYDYIAMHNLQKRNFPETEHEYFMRMMRELKVTRTTEKRDARNQKIKAAFAAVFSQLKFKRTESLESIYGR